MYQDELNLLTGFKVGLNIPLDQLQMILSDVCDNATSGIGIQSRAESGQQLLDYQGHRECIVRLNAVSVCARA